MHRFAPFIFALLFAGCAAAPSTETASGNPEIILTNVKIDCVRTLFVNSFANQGYTIRNASNSQVVAGKITTNSSAFWYRTFYGGPAEERVTISFLPLDTPNSVRIVSTAAYVSNPDTASEKVFDSGGTDADQVQLTDMKPLIERQCRK